MYLSGKDQKCEVFISNSEYRLSLSICLAKSAADCIWFRFLYHHTAAIQTCWLKIDNLRAFVHFYYHVLYFLVFFFSMLHVLYISMSAMETRDIL